MNENKKPEVGFENKAVQMTLDGPMQMTFDNTTSELMVTCYLVIGPGLPPIQARLQFTKDGTGHLFGGITTMVDQGRVTITPGAARTIQ